MAIAHPTSLSLRLVTRLPRKHLRCLYHDFALPLVILLLLALTTRYHHHHHSNYTPSAAQVSPKHTPAQLTSVPRNIYYLNSENIMYCYVPKNACSRFKALLRKRQGFANWNDTSLIHGKRNGLQRLHWLPHQQALHMLQHVGWKKFVVIRDPFARLVSAYQNKIAAPWPDQRADFWHKHLRHECPSIVSSLDMPTDGPLMSLEQFLECLLSDDKTAQSNEHWRLQTELCGLDHIRYERYVRIERLAEDVEELLRYLSWTEESAERLRMRRNAVYSRELTAYFSQRALELALRYYERDFEVLRYARVPQGRIEFYSVFDGFNFSRT